MGICKQPDESAPRKTAAATAAGGSGLFSTVDSCQAGLPKSHRHTLKERSVIWQSRAPPGAKQPHPHDSFLPVLGTTATNLQNLKGANRPSDFPADLQPSPHSPSPQRKGDDQSIRGLSSSTLQPDQAGCHKDLGGGVNDLGC